jgi:hypothetical protein
MGELFGIPIINIPPLIVSDYNSALVFFSHDFGLARLIQYDITTQLIFLGQAGGRKMVIFNRALRVVVRANMESVYNYTLGHM